MSDTDTSPASEAPPKAPFEISKKELLAQTGISYGQLYRWKREGLIPEEWFEKRSSFTGQETFFPREYALERIRIIQSMKDSYSLSEIRECIEKGETQQDLRKILLSLPEIDEKLVNALEVDLNTVVLSEASLRAIGVLLSALKKAHANEKTQISLLTETIKALDISSLASEEG